MAKNSPAVLFYTSDFLTGTFSMNYAEKGKYITLLCLQHQNGHISPKDFFKICKKSDEEVISKFIQDEDGCYYNERMEVEIVKRKAHSEKQRENIYKRWNKNGTQFGNTTVLPLDNENEKEKENKNNLEGNRGSRGKRETFEKPTVEQVKAYCKERGNKVDAAHFVDYYTSNGWKVGKQNMKDWKAAVRTWERNEFSKDKKAAGRLDFMASAIRENSYDSKRDTGLYISDGQPLVYLQASTE